MGCFLYQLFLYSHRVRHQWSLCFVCHFNLSYRRVAVGRSGRRGDFDDGVGALLRSDDVFVTAHRLDDEGEGGVGGDVVEGVELQVDFFQLAVVVWLRVCLAVGFADDIDLRCRARDVDGYARDRL